MRAPKLLATLMAIGSTGYAQTAQSVPNGNRVADRALSFLHTAAELIGTGLVRLFNLIMPADRAVSPELVMPLGYLGLLTVLLALFGILAAARKVIWILVGVGWILILVRVVIDALNAT